MFFSCCFSFNVGSSYEILKGGSEAVVGNFGIEWEDIGFDRDQLQYKISQQLALFLIELDKPRDSFT